MVLIDLAELLALAAGTDAFSQPELDVLKEVLEKSTHIENSPIDGTVPDYILIEERVENKAVGFVIFGRVPMTRSSWDIYWIATRRDLQGRGIGRALIRKVEDYLRARDVFAQVRLETSSRKDYDNTRIFYAKAGFVEAGRIADFYSQDDSLVIFSKKVEPVL